MKASTLEELQHYQSQGYTFTPGKAFGDGNVLHTPRRDWDDKWSVCVAFNEEYPISLPFRYDWNVGYRLYREDGYTDIEPTCNVYQDSEEVCYQNELNQPVFTSE